MLSYLFLCLIWGTTWIGIKISLEGLPPFFNAFTRFSLALISLFLFLLVKKISFRISRKEMKILVISGFFMYVFDYGLIYWGEQYLSAGVTAVFFSTFTIFTAIWAQFLFKSEPFKWHKFAGLILGMTGMAIVFLDQLIATQFNQMIIFASAAVVVGAAGGALAVVLVKKYLPELNPFRLTFYQTLSGVVFLGTLSLFLDDFSGLHINLRIAGAVLYLGIIGSALAFAMYYQLLQRLSATTLALIIYITPVIALLVDFLVFGEIVSLRVIIGVLVIFSGIGLTQGFRRPSFDSQSLLHE